MNSKKHRDWNPPKRPDPSSILHEAQFDTEEGRYEIALCKFIWFFEHACEHEPGQSGVRVSFALSYWHELAEQYPPAMERLLLEREKAVTKVEAGVDVHGSFRDVRALDRVLSDFKTTRDLFLELHQSDREKAREVYEIAQSVLVTFQHYEICLEYVQPETTFERIIEMGRMMREFPVSEIGTARREQAYEKMFARDTATIIALLVIAKRMDEARSIANRSLQEWSTPLISNAISEALEGIFPKQI